MQQCVICILDILGTKGIWTEQSVDKYFEVIEEVEKSLDAGKAHLRSLVPEGTLEFDYTTFSDTLILTIINKNRFDYFFEEIIGGFSQFVLGTFQQYFSHNFFVRGAISFGDVEKRGSHFVGPAVDDAAEYFELQDMIGICLTPKATIAAEYAIEWNRKFFNRDVGKFLLKYKTPMKNKSTLELYQINWPAHFKEKYNSETDISPLAELNIFLGKRNIPLIAASKFSNTIEFFKAAM